MRRRSKYEKKEVKPDYIHERVDIGRFINYLMRDGKKSIAEKVLYNTFDEMSKTIKDDPVKIFEKAIQNSSPALEVVSRRVGGANYQIPMEVRPERKYYLAAHWIIWAAQGRKGKPMHKKLAEELIAASKNEGAAIKKKQDTHRIAEANRAFASFIRH